MKQGKNPTVNQSKWLEAQGLNAPDWLISKATSTLTIIRHRITGETRELPAIR